jgi:uncharacterized DUF497 family protein
MSEITFEWDAAKATINKRKHGVGFEEAKSVFFDEKAKIIHDPEHSYNEERFVILGISVVMRMLVVVHCYRKKTKSFVSFPPGKQQRKNQYNTVEVIYEKGI